MSLYIHFGALWEQAFEAGKYRRVFLFISLLDGSLSDTAVNSLDVLDRQRNLKMEARGQQRGGGGGAAGMNNPATSTAAPGMVPGAAGAAGTGPGESTGTANAATNAKKDKEKDKTKDKESSQLAVAGTALKICLNQHHFDWFDRFIFCKPTQSQFFLPYLLIFYSRTYSNSGKNFNCINSFIHWSRRHHRESCQSANSQPQSAAA